MGGKYDRPKGGKSTENVKEEKGHGGGRGGAGRRRMGTLEQRGMQTKRSNRADVINRP